MVNVCCEVIFAFSLGNTSSFLKFKRGEKNKITKGWIILLSTQIVNFGNWFFCKWSAGFCSFKDLWLLVFYQTPFCSIFLFLLDLLKIDVSLIIHSAVVKFCHIFVMPSVDRLTFYNIVSILEIFIFLLPFCLIIDKVT